MDGIYYEVWRIEKYTDYCVAIGRRSYVGQNQLLTVLYKFTRLVKLRLININKRYLFSMLRKQHLKRNCYSFKARRGGLRLPIGMGSHMWLKIGS